MLASPGRGPLAALRRLDAQLIQVLGHPVKGSPLGANPSKDLSHNPGGALPKGASRPVQAP